MTASPAPAFELDELEHQALDLLDALPCGAAWIAAQTAQDEVLADSEAHTRAHTVQLEAAILDAGEQPDRVTAALPTATALLLRLVHSVAISLLEAAHALAHTESRGQLDPELLTQVEALLNESPEHSPAIAPAVETTGLILGLDRASIAWALLISLGEIAHAQAPAALRQASSTIAERLAAARPSEATATIATALRVFRSAAVATAGPSIRARLLAAERPDQLALATALVATPRTPAELVADFDAALRAQDQANAAPPEATTDGPKRKFTWVHLTLALIILGLTLWHYCWR